MMSFVRLGYKKTPISLLLAPSFGHADGASWHIVSCSVEKPTENGHPTEKPREKCQGTEVGLQAIAGEERSLANNHLSYLGTGSFPS